MRRILLAGLVAAALAAAPGPSGTAAADPAVDPVPPAPAPVPQPPAVGDPGLWLGPLDQLAPVTLLNPETYRMPDGQQPSPYVLAQGVPPGPFAYINELKGLHAMLHGAMGRMPGDELGTALPGTAPPPGTALPPGLEDFLPDPAALPTVAPPPPG